MKILMYSDAYGSVTTTFVRNEVAYIKEKCDLKYLCHKFESNNEKVDLLIVPFNQNPILRKLQWILWRNDWKCSFKNSKFSRNLNSLIDNENPDVIHCHFAYEGLKLIQNLSERNKERSIILHFHGYGASQMLRKNSYIKAIKEVLALPNLTSIVVSDFMKKGLERAGINLPKVELLRYGVNLNKFVENDIKESQLGSPKVFLQVSSLVQKKGHLYTLQAFKLFFENNPAKREQIKVLFTGDGSQKSSFEKLVKDFDLFGIVDFIGNVSHEQAVKLMGAADFYIHHSVTGENGDREGIPNSIMEAMAMKLPVLSTFHSGIPELVEHGVNGLLCEEKDVKTYAGQIEEILSWGKLDINRSRIEAEYNYEKHNARLFQLYTETNS